MVDGVDGAGVIDVCLHVGVVGVDLNTEVVGVCVFVVADLMVGVVGTVVVGTLVGFRVPCAVVRTLKFSL